MDSFNKSRIPFNEPFISGKELEYIREAVEVNGHLAGNGPFTKRCEGWLEREMDCTRVLLTNSCTGALEMAALLCGIKPGDEVIMPSFTFVSTANAFVLRGGVPVFVDIRSDTLALDESELEGAITPRTKAIVPVYYIGWGCDMETITRIAQRYGILVVEDAALGFLACLSRKNPGTYGDLGCLSFHETKSIICGEGGALLINNPLFKDRAEILRDKGTNRQRFLRGEVDRYTWVDIGSSFLPNELTAAFLWGQLENAYFIAETRKRLFSRYMEHLRPLGEQQVISLPMADTGEACNGHIFPILVRSSRERRELLNYLLQNGIHAVFHYIPLHSSPAGLRYGRAHGHLPVTVSVSERLVRLPIFSKMSPDMVDKISDAIKSFFQGTG